MSISLKITKENLPERLEQIPEDIKNWSSDLGKALVAKMQAEIEEERIEASMSIKIRQNPVDFGMAKATEDGIKARLLLCPEVIAAKAATVEATANYVAIRAVVDGLDAQRSSLKYLSELVSAGFISMSPVGM